MITSEQACAEKVYFILMDPAIDLCSAFVVSLTCTAKLYSALVK